MSFDILAQHDAIAWDCDGTLMGHPKSELMHDFILATPHKRHMIVTFRSHGAEDLIWRHFAHLYPEEPLRPEHFTGVLNVPDAAWEAHDRDTRRRRAGQLKGPWTAHETFYMTWKGLICRQHGLTVLVDDNAGHTLDGCTLHGITLINPDHF